MKNDKNSIIKLLLLIVSISSIIWHIMLFLNIVEFGIPDNSGNLSSYIQIKDGYHLYYEKNSLTNFGMARASQTYTPLAAEIHGLCFKIFGVHASISYIVGGVFTFLILALSALLVYKKSKSICLVFSSIAILLFLIPKWYYGGQGPNIICAFFVLLTFFTSYIYRKNLSLWSIFFIAVFSFLAFWSKQTALILYPLTILFVYLNTNGFKLTILLMSLLSFFTLSAIYYYEYVLVDSNFINWIFLHQGEQPLIWSRIITEWVFDISKKYGIIFGVILIGAYLDLKNYGFKFVLSKSEYIFPMLLISSGLFASLKYGSGYTQFLPGLIISVISMTIILSRFIKDRAIAKSLVYFLLAFQIILVSYDLRPYFFTKYDKDRYDYIVNILKNYKKSYIHTGPTGGGSGYFDIIAGKSSMAPHLIYEEYKNGIMNTEIKNTLENQYIQSSPWDIVIMHMPYEVHSFPLYDHLFNSKEYTIVQNLPPLQFAAITDYHTRRNTLIFMKAKK